MLIGQSPKIAKIKKQIRQIAQSDDNVFISGETGSGKEYAAREIHSRSRFKNRPFVIINCTALGDTTAESDLYGEKIEGPLGVERKIGLLEQMKKGILYLENVDELNSEFQKKFTNIIKEGKFRKPNDNRSVEINIRVIAATTKKDLSQKEDFRKDLLSLLNPFTIQIPSLRERKQDIPFLFNHFLDEYCKEFNIDLPSIPADLFESLIEYEWPGNVGELKKAVRNLVVMSPEGSLSAEFLPFEIKRHPFEHLVGRELPDALCEVEKYLIKKTLRRFAGNQSKAAHALAVSEAALRYKMKKYGLTRKAF
jgi:DNA-binding NtrC family response regulator